MKKLIMIIFLILIPCEARSNKFNQIDKMFITRNEGVVLHPYFDIAGYKTYCIGRLAPSTAHLKSHYTYQECEDLLDYDLEKFSEGVNDCIDRELTDNQYTAVIDFAYNLGVQSYCASTLHKDINENIESLKIKNDFLAWDKVDIKGKLIDNKAIKARRLREYNLFKQQGSMVNHSKYSNKKQE